MFCNKCGHKYTNSSHSFCMGCGTPAPPHQMPSQQPNTQMITPQPAPPYQMPSQQPNTQMITPQQGMSISQNQKIFDDRRCPRCQSTILTIITDTNTTSGKGYGCIKACIGTVILGPFGLLCGLCGKKKSKTTSEAFFMCMDCGNKFR